MEENSFSERFARIIEKINLESKNEEIIQEEHTELGSEDIENLRKKEEIDALTVANNLRREELEGRKQDREQRKEFAVKIYHFLCFYLSSVLLLILLSGTSIIRFELTEGIIITLLSTTTANIIGIFILVVKYLFATRK